jgi:DNA-binding beta-propeller fold protein YncE
MSGTITGYGTPTTAIVGGVTIRTTGAWVLGTGVTTMTVGSTTDTNGNPNAIQAGYQIWIDSTSTGATATLGTGMGIAANTFVASTYVVGSTTVPTTVALTNGMSPTTTAIAITGGGVSTYNGMKLTVTGTAVDGVTPISYTTDAILANATTFTIPSTYLFKAGTSYNVTISTAPQYATGAERTCTVYNGSGTVPTGADSTPVINNLVVDCGLNVANSRLLVGSATSVQTTALLATPTAPSLPGGAAYSTVTFADLKSINMFFATNGNYLSYVLNSPASGAGSLAVLQTTSAGATTAPAATAPAVQTLPLGNNPYGLAVSNGVVIATNTTDNNMTVATNTGPGTLTLVGNTTIGTGTSAPRGVAFHPSNGFAYVVASGANAVYPFTINMGATALADKNAATSISTGTTPYNIAVTPSGKYAYVTNYGDGTISKYSICQFTSNNCVRGTLSSLGTVAVPSANPLHIAADNTSVLVVTELGDVYHYAIGAGGALSLTANSLSLGAGVTGITLGNARNVFYLTSGAGVSPYNYSGTGIGTAGSLMTLTNAVGASTR